jgi:hypothetical protein
MARALVAPHRRDGGTLATMLAVPSVSVVKDHVHARRILGQVIDPEQLHHRRALSAATARIELPNAQQLRRLASAAWLTNGRANHGWKTVEVCHGKALRNRG